MFQQYTQEGCDFWYLFLLLQLQFSIMLCPNSSKWSTGTCRYFPRVFAKVDLPLPLLPTIMMRYSAKTINNHSCYHSTGCRGNTEQEPVLSYLISISTCLSGARSTTPSDPPTTPRTRHSDIKGPTCLGGKFVTAITCFLFNTSGVYRSVIWALVFRIPSSPKSIQSLCRFTCFWKSLLH